MQERYKSDVSKLRDSIGEIWEIAKDKGLDPYPVQFHMVPANIMYEFGAYGLPGRFSHWTHGKAFRDMKTMYDYGLSKIYELVINTNPAHAFLMENNELLQNKLVVAHVLGHVDFFKHNAAFQGTNRGMLDSTSLHASRMRQYEYKHGKNEMETLLDSILSVEWNIDKGSWLKDKYLETNQVVESQKKAEVRRSAYDDLLDLGVKKEAPKEESIAIPLEEEEDLLGFVATHSHHLKDWQKDVVRMIRDEAVYFLPQMMTKIMNEGWAAFWHVNIMREMGDRDHITTKDMIDFSNMNSGLLTPGGRSLNPYLVGFKIFEDRDKKFRGEYKPKNQNKKNWWGKEDDPKDYVGNPSYDIFQIRESTPTDQSFLRNYLTPELVEELDLFTYKHEEGQWIISEKDPNEVINNLVNSMTNFGQPVIKVAVGGGDYMRNGELYLKHIRDDTRVLEMNYAKKTLQSLQKLWGRSVHLETENDEGGLLLSCHEGKDISDKKLAKS